MTRKSFFLVLALCFLSVFLLPTLNAAPIYVGPGQVNTSSAAALSPGGAPPSSERTNASPLIAPAETSVQPPSMVTQAVALTLVASLPYIVILLTAYIKIVVVLSILRNALGIQQSPPNQVINGLALILSFYVMYPTGLAMYEASKSAIEAHHTTELISTKSAQFVIAAADAAKEPLRGFLDRNSQTAITKSFFKLANRMMPEDMRADLKTTDFIVLLPSYIISQLKAAYEIGVLIYLPFFVIDIVTSNILLAMGMMMLSPLSISLPLKLLLLVMLDGWTVLIQGLVLTFR